MLPVGVSVLELPGAVGDGFSCHPGADVGGGAQLDGLSIRLPGGVDGFHSVKSRDWANWVSAVWKSRSSWRSRRTSIPTATDRGHFSSHCQIRVLCALVGCQVSVP